MSPRRCARWAAPFLVAASVTHAAAAEEPAAPMGAAEALLLPPLQRSMTRIHGTVRPFFIVDGPGGGAISDLAIEHYWKQPWKLGVELSPLALVGEPEGLGAIAHARVRAAFATDYLEVGIGVGARMQHFGPSGWSVAPMVRLGALDGLNLRIELGYSLIRNYYTRRAQFAWADVIGELDVPVTRRLAVTVEGAYGFDLWVYATLGLKQRIYGNGGPGTTIVGTAFGAAWVVDRFPCQYGDVAPCRGAAQGVGPTVALSLERRF